MIMSAGGKNLGIRPSISVQSRDDVYTYHKEGDSVLDMHQRYNTLYVYTDAVESRVVGDSLVPLL